MYIRIERPGSAKGNVKYYVEYIEIYSISFFFVYIPTSFEKYPLEI